LFEETEMMSNDNHNLEDASFSLDDGESFLNKDLATTAETGTRFSTLSGNKSKKNNNIKKNKDRQKKRKSSLFKLDKFGQIGLRKNFQDISKEAWMCGVCAKSFSSFDAAQKHEDYHIKEVVTDLGWMCNAAISSERHSNNIMNLSSLNLPVFSTPRNSVVVDHESTPNPSQRTSFTPSTRPDFLTMSRTNLTQSSKGNLRYDTPLKDNIKPNFSGFNVSNRTGGGQHHDASYERINDYVDFDAEYNLLLPHGMRDCIVLADEALIDVCNKAEKLALTELEREAEFELECYSKDKHYYDMLERREVDRQRGGAYAKFRKDGKNVVEKVQNKFVDAYALMKEGKSGDKMVSVDHYKRKLKGEEDVNNIIENTKETLYVNVIVKNSIKVVSHELERLARQRWEEDKAKNKQDGTLEHRDGESRTQFEKFKAAAQGNLVKLAGLALASDFTPRRIAVQLSNDLYRYVQ
jgi:hypothetical protein